jgi:hypothetical protein
LKKGGALSAPRADGGDMTKAEMAAKLLQYQQFMAKYIVEAQQQKSKAVQATELAMKNKFEEKLRLLSGSVSVEAAPAVQPQATQLYQERSAKVSAAAQAGKSRWGDLENEKAAKAAAAAPVTPSIVNGALNGVAVNGAAVPAVTNIGQSLFDERNAMVAAAGKAGKSRWGEMEIAKATKLAASLPAASTAAVSVEFPPEIVAADHGLRNDGGVGGPSLAERVNLGAQLFELSGAAAAPFVSVVASSAPSLYDKRNAMIAAAGKAGKSRWGDMEIVKVTKLAASLPAASTSVALAPVPPEVEAADHGLRADGGVGGPSLAQRVNLGAALLDQ